MLWLFRPGQDDKVETLHDENLYNPWCHLVARDRCCNQSTVDAEMNITSSLQKRILDRHT